ncbi:MAG: M16 family metallopeptidase [Oceanihabitans sp.]
MKLSSISLIVCGFLFISCQTKNEAKPEKEFKIAYEKFTLDNGLEVILHEDHSDPIVAVATMMHVGSNREKPGKTGFAHFFEHMSFNDSENVPVGANRKMIPEWGGSRNGGTWSDGTVYYEVVPKDAFEKILWIDSDRFGYMINTVTESALEREKQVVKNEKRQRVDNAPYGYTDEIIRKNLYPEGHPYSWTVIGALPDLQAATITDVKEFYTTYYGAKNGSLVIAGDIDIAETKALVKKWFGEIPSGPDVEALKPMPVNLTETKSLYFEDNFAKLPELRMVIPTIEEYHKDVYALQVLGQLLSGSKNAPLYQVVVEEKKTSS